MINSELPPMIIEESAIKEWVENRLKIQELETQSKFDPLRSEIREGFAKIDVRFAEIDVRFAQVDGRFAKMDIKFAQLETQIAKSENSLTWKFIGLVPLILGANYLMLQGFLKQISQSVPVAQVAPPVGYGAQQTKPKLP